MSIHPGDIIRWQGGSHQVVAIRPTYLTLRAVDGDGDGDARLLGRAADVGGAGHAVLAVFQKAPAL